MQAAGRSGGIRTMSNDALDVYRRSPEHVITIDGDTERTAGQIYREARALAGAMMKRGLKPGDRISWQLPNWYEAIVIDLAATMAGLIVNPLVPIYRESEVTFMVGEIGSKILFIPQSFRGYDYI